MLELITSPNMLFVYLILRYYTQFELYYLFIFETKMIFFRITNESKIFCLLFYIVLIFMIRWRLITVATTNWMNNEARQWNEPAHSHFNILQKEVEWEKCKKIKKNAWARVKVSIFNAIWICDRIFCVNGSTLDERYRNLPVNIWN